jgi:hypothetical protein
VLSIELADARIFQISPAAYFTFLMKGSGGVQWLQHEQGLARGSNAARVGLLIDSHGVNQHESRLL